MANDTLAKYLKFLARLYDLVADFDERELMDIQRSATREHKELISAIASLLMELRRYESSSAKRKSNPDSAIADLTGNSDEALREVLSSRNIFPSNAALAEFVCSHFFVPTRPKDSRDRIVARVLRASEEAGSKKRNSFKKALEAHIVHENAGSDFVARWTKLIRSL